MIGFGGVGLAPTWTKLQDSGVDVGQCDAPATRHVAAGALATLPAIQPDAGLSDDIHTVGACMTLVSRYPVGQELPQGIPASLAGVLRLLESI
jgi:hypothetical protein